MSLGAGPACQGLGAGERSLCTLPMQRQEEQAFGQSVGSGDGAGLTQLTDLAA